VKIGGAVTEAGPTPTWGTPNSNGFKVSGTDANGAAGAPADCDKTQVAAKPAIGVLDNAGVTAVKNQLGVPQNYTGNLPTADVETVFQDGLPTPTGLDAFVTSVTNQVQLTCSPGTIASTGASKCIDPSVGGVYTGPITDADLAANGTMGGYGQPMFNVVNGDLTITGNPVGFGILVVTGKLIMKGDFTWNGVILAVGQGDAELKGGGNAQITGAFYVAKTRDNTGNLLSQLGTPTVDWSGGGGNGIQYDHCWSDSLLKKIPYVPPLTPTPYRILSTRMLEF
jgi:hypothetical protein